MFTKVENNVFQNHTFLKNIRPEITKQKLKIHKRSKRGHDFFEPFDLISLSKVQVSFLSLLINWPWDCLWIHPFSANLVIYLFEVDWDNSYCFPIIWYSLVVNFFGRASRKSSLLFFLWVISILSLANIKRLLLYAPVRIWSYLTLFQNLFVHILQSVVKYHSLKFLQSKKSLKAKNRLTPIAITKLPGLLFVRKQTYHITY